MITPEDFVGTNRVFFPDHREQVLLKQDETVAFSSSNHCRPKGKPVSPFEKKKKIITRAT